MSGAVGTRESSVITSLALKGMAWVVPMRTSSSIGDALYGAAVDLDVKIAVLRGRVGSILAVEKQEIADILARSNLLFDATVAFGVGF